MGLSGAERQARYRAKQAAEVADLRQRAAAAADGAHAPDAELARVRRERDDALARVLELAAELRQAHSQLRWQGREHAPIGPEISKPLYRWLLGELHPDRIVDPAIKAYLNDVFVRFQARVERGGGGRLPTLEEMMQNRAETHRKNRERGKKGAETKKRNKAAKQAAAGDTGTDGGCT